LQSGKAAIPSSSTSRDVPQSGDRKTCKRTVPKVGHALAVRALNSHDADNEVRRQRGRRTRQLRDRWNSCSFELFFQGSRPGDPQR